ncbi:MAG: hypothetical protein AB4206_20680 [Xenococcaceae cyanobacterium]
MKIMHLIANDAALLLVYSTSNHLYSYQILFSNGFINLSNLIHLDSVFFRLK